MKKVIITMALLTGIVTISSAQVKENNKRSDRKNLKTELNLTDEQCQKMQELNQDLRSKRKELTKQHQEAMNQILTPEQQTKLNEVKKERPRHTAKRGDLRKGQNRKNHERRSRQFAHKNREKSSFNLDEITISKLDSLEDQFFKEKQDIKKRKISSEEQQKQISELRKKYRNERREIVRESYKKTKSNS